MAAYGFTEPRASIYLHKVYTSDKNYCNFSHRQNNLKIFREDEPKARGDKRAKQTEEVVD